MARVKDKVFQIRASETFMNLMKELADKKRNVASEPY